MERHYSMSGVYGEKHRLLNRQGRISVVGAGLVYTVLRVRNFA